MDRAVKTSVSTPKPSATMATVCEKLSSRHTFLEIGRKSRTKIEWICVKAASCNPETVNPWNEFSTLSKVGGALTKGYSQNAKPSEIRSVSRSVNDLDAQLSVFIPS